MTELSIDIPTELKSPDLSICLRYVDIIDIGRFSRDRNISIGESDVNGKYSPFNIQLVQESVTIADIFNYTPSVDDIFLSCLARLPQSYEYKPANGNGCYELFTVVNFYLQGLKDSNLWDLLLIEKEWIYICSLENLINTVC